MLKKSLLTQQSLRLISGTMVINVLLYVAILRDPRHHRQMTELVPWLSFSQALKTAAWHEAHAPALDWQV